MALLGKDASAQASLQLSRSTACNAVCLPVATSRIATYIQRVVLHQQVARHRLAAAAMLLHVAHGAGRWHKRGAKDAQAPCKVEDMSAGAQTASTQVHNRRRGVTSRYAQHNQAKYCGHHQHTTPRTDLKVCCSEVHRERVSGPFAPHSSRHAMLNISPPQA